MQELQNQIQKALNHLKEIYGQLQIGRAQPMLVESIAVEQYGSKMPLKNVANISVPDAQTIRIEPWDKSMVAEIEKAIIAANTGLNPRNMGESLLVPVPPLTEERRKQLVKVVHAEAEEARISLRNIRQNFLKQIKKQKEDGDISEDEQKKAEKKCQEAIDAGNKAIEDRMKAKEKDVMSV